MLAVRCRMEKIGSCSSDHGQRADASRVQRRRRWCRVGSHPLRPSALACRRISTARSAIAFIYGGNASGGFFTTKDPIGFAGGDTDVYAYVANDPVNQIDPSGNFAGAPLPPLPLPAAGLAGPVAAVVGAGLGGAGLGYFCFESGFCDFTDWFFDDDHDFGSVDDVCASSGGRPGNNQAQNRQFRQAVAACEEELGIFLSDAQLRRLHDSIHHLENPGYWEILEECVGLFG